MTRTLGYITPIIPAFVILGFFVWFANWIPQTRWQPPQKLAIGATMTPSQLAEAGKTIVRERGCLTCHTLEPGVGVKGGGRGPNLWGLAPRRAQGVPGGPDTLTDYLAQALYEPGAYLVESYANIMPPSTGAPAKLTYEEVVAVVAYLQSLGGTPTVRVGDVPRPPGQTAVAAAPLETAPGPAATNDPAAMLNALGCIACHSLKAGEVKLGPALDPASLQQTARERAMSVEAHLMESIVDPGAFEKQGLPAGVMPKDYGSKLTASQLQAIVAYLSAPEGKR